MKPGWVWRSQIWWSPAAHCAHVPHAQTNGTITRSPGPPRRHALADRLDHARELVARDVREASRCRGRGPSSRASRCGTGRSPRRGSRRRAARAPGRRRSRPSAAARRPRRRRRARAEAYAGRLPSSSEDRSTREGPMPQPFTHLNLADVEDAAPGNGFGDRWEARVAREPLGGRGDRRHVLPPAPREAQPVHPPPHGGRGDLRDHRRHGRMKLDDEIVEVRRLDAIRVPPRHRAGVRGGRRGARVHRVRPAPPGDGEPVDDPWTA